MNPYDLAKLKQALVRLEVFLGAACTVLYEADDARIYSVEPLVQLAHDDTLDLLEDLHAYFAEAGEQFAGRVGEAGESVSPPPRKG